MPSQSRLHLFTSDSYAYNTHWSRLYEDPVTDLPPSQSRSILPSSNPGDPTTVCNLASLLSAVVNAPFGALPCLVWGPSHDRRVAFLIILEPVFGATSFKLDPCLSQGRRLRPLGASSLSLSLPKTWKKWPVARGSRRQPQLPESPRLPVSVTRSRPVYTR